MPTSTPVESGLCAVCGTPGVRLRHVTRSYGRGRSLLVMENVPVWVCPNCGESYLTADTLAALDRIKAQRRKVAVPTQVVDAFMTGSPAVILSRAFSRRGRPAPLARRSLAK